MRHILLAGMVSLLGSLPAPAAELPPAAALGLPLQSTIEFAAIDRAALLAEDGARPAPGPLRYGTVLQADRRLAGPGSSATDWRALPDGRLAARWQVRVPGAQSLDFLFSRFHLPPGALLYFYDAEMSTIRGPYDEQHNSPDRPLPLPFVPGDRALIEVVAPPALAARVRLELGRVTAAYRRLWELDAADKSGSCNVDVVCPAGDAWRDQIASVARYTFGGFLCTGQVIASAGGGATAYFLTANHCVSSDLEAQSMVLYFNYESPTCRTPGSAASGTQIPVAGFDDTLSGATLRATNAQSDFTLVELSQVPPPDYSVYASGWDRRAAAPPAVTAIHHPQGHAKRISFEHDPVCASSYLDDCGGAETHWRIEDWDLGTTEGGSSGSGIWNPDGRLIGQLHGGGAACGNDLPDWYGRFSVSWDFGATAETRLEDWLDPLDSGLEFVNGHPFGRIFANGFERSTP